MLLCLCRLHTAPFTKRRSVSLWAIWARWGPAWQESGECVMSRAKIQKPAKQSESSRVLTTHLSQVCLLCAYVCVCFSAMLVFFVFLYFFALSAKYFSTVHLLPTCGTYNVFLAHFLLFFSSWVVVSSWNAEMKTVNRQCNESVRQNNNSWLGLRWDNLHSLCLSILLHLPGCGRNGINDVCA